MTPIARGLLFLVPVLLLAASPAVNAVIIQAHSPVTLLVTDPSGHYKIGCLDGSCTSTSSPQFVDTMPPGEGATYSFCPTPSSSDCPSVTISDASPGTWTVQFFSTLTESETGHVYITVQQCTGTHGCATIDIVGTPDNPVSITQGSTGAATFYLTPTGLSVPEFPLGLVLLIGVLAPVLIVIGRVQRDRRKRDAQ